jgi:membrane-bound metal-dependent hydrolase YbcI (DUF457 family)
MAGLGHLGIGFAAKAIAPKIHLAVLLVATELIDILWGIFYFTGIDKANGGLNSTVLSHSLFISLIWSALAALLAARIYHDRRSGMVVGSLVFSHWILDFITHPMGAIFGGVPLSPDLPLFFDGSPRVGLGLYNHSMMVAIAADMAILLIGFVVYLRYRAKSLKKN